MKQPHKTRKERRQEAASDMDQLITDLGDSIRRAAPDITKMLDRLEERGGVNVLLLQHPMGMLKLNENGGLHGLSLDAFLQAVRHKEPAMADMLDRGVPCGHVMLVVSLPNHVQACCPVCDYDVRNVARKVN